ncbi:MAG: hypothetical protein HOF01_10760 [Chloroflexi bacterium]|nr:hypothetical protein [Chloroflexota bacterium]
MHKYESPVRESTAAEGVDKRDASRRLFDSSLAKLVRVISILLGVYAPIGILLGVLILFAANMTGEPDEDDARSAQRRLGLVAFGVGVSGIASGYVSYRTWRTASNIRRSNRRRAKGLD